jgi:galactokinase
MPRAERDLDDFERLVRDLPSRFPNLADFFDGAEKLVLARAPGRLDVMGGFADYSGSLVLELPLAEAACVAAARCDDPWVRVVSLPADDGAPLRQARFAARAFWQACRDLPTGRHYFAGQPESARFAAYALGGLPELGALGGELSSGLRLLIDSAVPEGKGVSSSAALEVAALAALAALFGVRLSGPELGALGQRVENEVVGAACGVMDQLTSACGVAGQLLALLCQPATLEGSLALPEGLSVFGVDSGLRHAVAGADYSRVRAAAFMGLRILSERLGARVRASGIGRVVLEDDPLGGYLARLSPDGLNRDLLEALPERITGADFLRRFAGITDTLTNVEPAAVYRVRAAALHPIYEHARARRFAQTLTGATQSADYARLGALMFASHASYSACGLGSDGTDQLVEAARALGHESGVFGAKISGGGSGGSVVILARTERLPEVLALSRAYAEKSGQSSRVFFASSAGASAVPPRRLTLTP